ncbi:MAG: putative ABC transporter permease [Bacilli bacterium]|nr:putative ABC transporter permease [Bacilli bacterium]MDD4733964.1 putative ABC transporter permease [Bacilli bacterium]
MNNLIYYFLLFILYSIIGWCIEIIWVGINKKELVNRGFLIGPYCPIYGIGSLLIIILLKDYYNNPLLLFILAALICTVLEYIISYIMEKLFRARWWDYSHLSFNVNGRIYLGNSALFGICGIALSLIHPYVNELILNVPSNISYIIFATLLIVFVFDVLTSVKIVSKLEMAAEAVKKDYTGELKEIVGSILKEKSKLLKRLALAYPKMVIKKKKSH